MADRAGVEPGFQAGEALVRRDRRRAEAIVALEMDSGRVRWELQARPGADDLYTNERLGGEDEGPDLDFGQSPILFGGATDHEWLACGQKSGWMYLLGAPTGRKIWETKVGAGGAGGATVARVARGGSTHRRPIGVGFDLHAALPDRRHCMRSAAGVGGRHRRPAAPSPQCFYVGRER